MCYARGSLVARAIVNNQKTLNEPELRKTTMAKSTRSPTTKTHFPKEWKKIPGKAGFVDYLGQILAVAEHAGEISTMVKCVKFDPSQQLDLMLWQSLLKWYFRPQSPVQRILLGWELGTGKTVGILVTLDNYFDDKRPKILFFHTPELVGNFYSELSSFPNKYRDWYTSKYPEAGPYPDDEDKKVNEAWLDKFKETLQSYAAHRDGKSTPLKCFLYPHGGNKSISTESIMKQYGAEDRMLNNLEKLNFSNMIIIGDEAHQLTDPSPDVFHVDQRKAVLRCADRIQKSRNSIVMMMTATPPIHNISRFMSVVTGKDLGFKSDEGLSVNDRLARGAENLGAMEKSGVLEGHIAWYMHRDPKVFAIATPDLATIPKLIPCVLNGTQLHNYLARRFLRKASYTVPREFQGPKKCRESQELINERCKKKCNPGQVRNDKGNCLNECIPPKVRNAKGRCANPSAVTGGSFFDDMAGLPSDLEHLSTSSQSLEVRQAERRTSGRKLSCVDLSSYVGDKSTDCPANIGTYEHPTLFNPTQQNSMKYTVENALSTCIKLSRMADDALRFSGKVAILIHRKNAYKALSKVFEMRGLPSYNNKNGAAQTHIIMPAKATGERLPEKKRREAEARSLIAQFNKADNSRGDKQKIILLNSENYTEGVSLYDCRLIILGDLSIDRTYPSWALMTQRLARALRMCRHVNLPERERTLETRLYVTVMPDEAQIRREITNKKLPDIPDDEIDQIMSARTVDEEKLAIIEQQRDITVKAMRLLGNMSIDRGYWENRKTRVLSDVGKPGALLSL
jgi:hypothetical protein